MHRFFVPSGRASGELVTLEPGDSHHAFRVLRLQPGDPIVILDGDGLEAQSVIEHCGRGLVTARIQNRRLHPPNESEVILVQAIAKTQAMDGVVHRAVELGCRAIQPLLTAHSVSRPEDLESKREKWQSIATEAAKQCGNPWLTRVLSVRTPSEWLSQCSPGDRILVGSLVDSPEPLRGILRDWKNRSTTPTARIFVLIGPEGDFTATEYAAFREFGARPISLGPLVLRVETAAIATLAILQQALREEHSKNSAAE
jgi:16S rRNA (uracil1498-N3)-methyltransferase